MILKRHFASLFELTPEERGSMLALWSERRQILMAERNPDGCHIGINAAAIVRACIEVKSDPAASLECSCAAIPTCC